MRYFGQIRILVLTALVLVTTPTISLHSLAAQSNNADTLAEEKKRRQDIERKALVLLDEIVAAASSLKLPENRLLVLTSAAHLLWPHDEKKARNLFWEAANALNVIRPTKLANQGERSAMITYGEIFGWRRQLLRLAGSRDPELALELLQATKQTPPEQMNPEWSMPGERELEHQIAFSAAESDPKRAFELARQSLSKGVSLELINLLYQLSQKDTELASKFAGEMADKIRTGGLDTDPRMLHVATSLLTATRRSPATGEKNTQTSTTFKPLVMTDEQKRGLVELIANTALSMSASSRVLYATSQVMPEIEEFAPERALLLKRKFTEFEQRLPARMKLQNEMNSLVRNGQAEEILRASIKGNDEERSWLEHEAILAALFSKKSDAIREMVNKEIVDESRRNKILDYLDSKEIELAVQRGDAERLRKLLPVIRLKEERARAMTEIAMVLEKSGKHDEAVSLLDEAQGLIKTDLQSQTKSYALLNLMLAYALVDPPKAFALVERTIDKANDEVSKVLLLDRIVKTGFLKNGEIVLHESSALPTEFAVIKYGKGIVALAMVDFNRTRSAAERFERHELRIMARLLIAQALLGGEQNSKLPPL